jgi:metal transporter CNNM
MDPITWAGVALCLSQSALFSGLNLAVFSVGRLRLEVAAAGGDPAAERVLALRRAPNLLLATILWGNVGANVLLTLLADSVLTGVAAFFFSTVVITFAGEIFPQAYFSRRAVRIAARFAPMLRFYELLLYPVARPSAWLLDRMVGQEPVTFFPERDLLELIRKHVEAEESDVSRIEGAGAINFLELDDVPLAREGEAVDPRSVLSLPLEGGRPVIPHFERAAGDPFLQRVQASGKKWVIITDPAGEPCLVMDAHRFLRDALFGGAAFDPKAHWHRPIVVRDPSTPLGEVIGRLRVHPQSPEDDVVDEDFILLWGEQKRVITGSDILGRLLRGIASLEASRGPGQPASS